VFEYGSDVIKIYPDGTGKQSAFREAGGLAALEGCALAVPVVTSVGSVDGRWAIVMSKGPDTDDADWPVGALASLHVQVHRLRAGRLGDLKLKLSADISAAALLSRTERSTLLGLLEHLPSGDRLCHGDFHPGNILGSPASPFIVDWVDASCGAPEADACRTYLLALNNMPRLAGPYLEAYSATSGRDPATILSWLPVVAGARLAENIPGEHESLLQLVQRSLP
jgi:hypothetical protein